MKLAWNVDDILSISTTRQWFIHRIADIEIIVTRPRSK